MDDVSKIIKDAVESTIGGNSYENDKVNQWSGTVVDTCIQVLTQLQKPYKYIGECVIEEFFTQVLLIPDYGLQSLA